jgi:hypothetical protein
MTCRSNCLVGCDLIHEGQWPTRPTSAGRDSTRILGWVWARPACLSSPRARAPLLGSSCRKSVNYRLWLDAHIITCIAFSSIETEHKCETLFYLRWSLETWILENISSTTRSIGATWFQQFWSLNQRTRSVISIVCHQPCHIFRLVSPPFSIATHGPSMVSFSPR